MRGVKGSAMSREERNRRARERQRAKRAADPLEARARQRAYYKRKVAEDSDWARRRDVKYYTPARATRQWANDIQRKYGLSVEGYCALLLKQGGRCAVCGTDDPTRGAPTSRSVRRFYVDHCHTTGRIRGLLCSACNLGIGKLGDTKEALGRALRYLENAA